MTRTDQALRLLDEMCEAHTFGKPETFTDREWALRALLTSGEDDGNIREVTADDVAAGLKATYPLHYCVMRGEEKAFRESIIRDAMETFRARLAGKEKADG